MSALTLVDGGRDDAPLKKGSKEWADDVRNRARQLAKTINSGYMQLARYLYEISETGIDGDPRRAPWFTQWGYATFTDWADKELGIYGRKAEYFRRIWYKLRVENGGPMLPEEMEDRLISIGWSKVKELVRVLTAENAEEWIQRAEDVNLQTLMYDVQRHIDNVKKAKAQAEEYGTDPDEAAEEAKNAGIDHEAEVAVTKKFVFFDDQWDNTKLALEKAKKVAGNQGRNNEGYLLDLICMEYLATNTFEELDEATRVMMLHRISNFFGYKLVIIDPKKPVGDKVIYGYSQLEALAKAAAGEGEDEG